jgi:hypothetical protein
MIRQGMPLGEALDDPGVRRFGEKIMHLFDNLARDLRANHDVCPAKPDSTFADRAPGPQAVARRAEVTQLLSTFWHFSENPSLAELRFPSCSNFDQSRPA